MKKIILLLLSVALCNNSAYSQKIAAEKVPASVITAFKTKYPTVTKSTWELENKTEFEVNFKLDGKKVSANFDNTGNWLETETEIKVSALPESILSILKSDFEGFKIEEASKIESFKNGICFETEIEKGKETFDVLFSADGKVISKTKEEEKRD